MRPRAFWLPHGLLVVLRATAAQKPLHSGVRGRGEPSDSRSMLRGRTSFRVPLRLTGDERYGLHSQSALSPLVSAFRRSVSQSYSDPSRERLHFALIEDCPILGISTNQFSTSRHLKDRCPANKPMMGVSIILLADVITLCDLLNIMDRSVNGARSSTELRRAACIFNMFRRRFGGWHAGFGRHKLAA